MLHSVDTPSFHRKCPQLPHVVEGEEEEEKACWVEGFVLLHPGIRQEEHVGVFRI